MHIAWTELIFTDIGLRYCELTVFKWWPSVIFDFLKCKFLTTNEAKRAIERHPAKFLGDLKAVDELWQFNGFAINGR